MEKENATNGTEPPLDDTPFSFTFPDVITIPKEYEMFLYGLIFVAIMVGNLWVIVAVFRQPQLRQSPTNLFIISLSVSDLFVGLFQVPHHFLFEFLPEVFNLVTSIEFVCRFTGLMQWTARCATVFSLVGVAIDRYRAIVQPLKPRVTHRQAVLIIAIIWCASFAYSSYRAVLFHVEVLTNIYNQVKRYCMIRIQYRAIFDRFRIVDFCVMYICPLAVILSLYAVMISSLWFKKGPSSSSNRNKRKAVKMLSLVVILFAFSWLPYYTVELYNVLVPFSSKPTLMFTLIDVQYHIVNVAFVGNSCVNPFLYAYFNANFRKEFYRMFSCLVRCCERENAERRSKPAKVEVVQGAVGDVSAKTDGTRLSRSSKSQNAIEEEPPSAAINSN